MSPRRTRARRVLGLATVIVAASASSRVVGAGQNAGPLMILAPAIADAIPRAAPALDPWERRVARVALNASVNAARADGTSALATAGQVAIDLFDGESITAINDRYDRNDGGVTWVGHVAARPGSLVTIVHGSGAIAASIRLPDAEYTLRPAPRDPADPAVVVPGYVLVQVNAAGFLREAPPIVPEGSITVTANELTTDAVMADTADFVDVMVAYTALAEAWAGGPAGIINWINLGISETNSAYATSGVAQRLRLMNSVRVAYTEVSSFSTNLTNLRTGVGGLSTIAALRDSYTADLVTMFVRPASPDACGIAYLMTNVSTTFAPTGFSVVDSPCVSPNSTLAHELGHNMGLRHDWYVDGGTTPFTWAHGYVNTVARFRTVMAYPDACTVQGFSCTRLLAFSNPDLTYLGQPGGIPGGTNAPCPTGNVANMACDADERRALNSTALTVANFREYSTLRPPSILAQPQSPSVPRGQPLTLQVTADGLGPITYQWYRGVAPSSSQPIPGATGPSYTFTPGSDGIWFERWFYWVQVRNSIGSVDSITATVTMLAPSASTAATRRNPAQITGPVVGRVARDSPKPPPAVAAPGHGAKLSGLTFAGVSSDDSSCRQQAKSNAVLAWIRSAKSLSDPLEDAAAKVAALARLIVVVGQLDAACADGR